MTLVPVIGFIAVALLAILFATFALWRGKSKGWPLLAGAIALFLLGIGGGTYWLTGRPALAVRAAQGLRTHEVNGLVPFLIARVRKEPGDLQAWIYLGGAYMAAEDPGDAAKAYGRAVTVARLRKTVSPGLYAAYGEALVASNSDAVSDEAVAAFTAALALNPKDPAARFFLAQARAEHGDKARRPGAVAGIAGGDARQFAAAPDIDRPHGAVDGSEGAAQAGRPIPGRWWRNWRRS